MDDFGGFQKRSERVLNNIGGRCSSWGEKKKKNSIKPSWHQGKESLLQADRYYNTLLPGCKMSLGCFGCKGNVVDNGHPT